MSEGYRGRFVLFAFLGGAAAGAVAALLNAPSSGVELRDRLRATGTKEIARARHLPEAIRAATIAAEEAFIAALESEVADAPPSRNGRGVKARQLPAAG